MIDKDGKRLARFSYSVIKVVPDPVKGEAINVGVIVVSNEGEGRLRWNPNFKTRVRALQRGFSTGGVERAIAGLEEVLSADPRQQTLWDTSRVVTDEKLLASLVGRFNNQLQITEPQRYQSPSIDKATEQLFQRFVARRAENSLIEKRLTHAQLKERIWKIVKSWDVRTNLHVEQGGFLEGESARHPADIVIRNGNPRAALFALALHHDDRNLAYLYRDSLPTIVRDMQRAGHDFSAYAVLPDPEHGAHMKEDTFAQETRRLLNQETGVKAITLSQIDLVREEVVVPLL